MYLAVGLLLGYSIGKEKPTNKPDAVTVDIVKEGDEILIYEHYSGELIFEYNRNKEGLKSEYRFTLNPTRFREVEEIGKEVKNY